LVAEPPAFFIAVDRGIARGVSSARQKISAGFSVRSSKPTSEPGPPRVGSCCTARSRSQRCCAAVDGEPSGAVRRSGGVAGRRVAVIPTRVFSLGPTGRIELCEIATALGCATKGQVDSRVSRSSPVCLATGALERYRSRPYYRVVPEQNGACLVNAELQRRIKVMKHLLSGVAIVAALACAAPVWAQRTGPGATAGTGTGPAVNPPGGPGPSSPLYNLPQGSPGIPGTPQSGYPGSPGAAASGFVPGVPVPGAPVPGATTSAEPPTHRHARGSHKVAMQHAPPSSFSGSSANQLNQEELARVAAGNFTPPPPPPGPEPSASNPEVGPGRAARRARQ
jgi:hypothetical protein